MKKLALAASILAVSACTMPSHSMGYAVIMPELKDSVLVTGEVGTKVGKACATSYTAFFTVGDMSIEAAKKNGKITKVASVDREVTNFAVYAKSCTVVTGN